MSDKHTCLVGALGLLEHEISLLKSILRISQNRDHIPYELIFDDLSRAHIVIISVENEAAIESWQELAKSNPPPIQLTISPKELGKFPGYSFSRPFSPVKVLEVLDQIVEKELSHLFNEQIFNGKDQTKPRNEFDSNLVAQGNHRALVVEDSKTVQNQLKHELFSSNILADIADTGEQGIAMIEKYHYDIIFLDIVLPGVDGYQVCKKIRRNQDRKNIPVVMLTSKSSPFDKVRGSMAGCSTYLTKPVDYEKFYRVLDQYILKKNAF